MRNIIVIAFIAILLIISFSGLSYGAQKPIKHMINSTNWDINLKNYGVMDFAPVLYYDYKEKYFPVDVHGDDYNVTNNHENYDKGRFPSTPVCYYNIVSYDIFMVYEYWFYYAYNDYNYYSIKINDLHEHDFESVFIWVNDSSNSVFYIVTSMHLWMQRYDNVSNNHPVVYVERGGHGMSLDKKLIDGIPMVFDKVGRVITYNQFKFENFSDLKKHAKDDLDSNGYYKTDEKSTVHVKAPWLRDVFKDPDMLRNSKSGDSNQKSVSETSHLLKYHKSTLKISERINENLFPKSIKVRAFNPSFFLISKVSHLKFHISLHRKAHLEPALLV